MSLTNPDTKNTERASHEAIESTGGNATGVAETPLERVDHEAMEMAKRGQNRIHKAESDNPNDSIFTK